MIMGKSTIAPFLKMVGLLLPMMASSSAHYENTVAITVTSRYFRR